MLSDQHPGLRSASTYRLPIYTRITLSAARGRRPYLARLGVERVHVTVFHRGPGSTHATTCATTTKSIRSWGRRGARGFTAAIAGHGRHHIVDFVPITWGWNRHECLVEGRLENGPSSQAAIFFDIDWRPIKAEYRPAPLANTQRSIRTRPGARRAAAPSPAARRIAIWRPGAPHRSQPGGPAVQRCREGLTASWAPTTCAERVPQHQQIAPESSVLYGTDPSG